MSFTLDFTCCSHYCRAMTSASRRDYLIYAGLILCGGALFRFIYSGTFLLAPDETNYWQWSRHLAWGYHDQAPMIAWMIKLSTAVFGHTEQGVRFPSVLAVTVASGYLAAIAKRWFGSYIAYATVLITQVILLYLVGGLLATPDGLQAAAWAGASYHVACGYQTGKWSQWLLGGFWFGFGMLSKYTMVIFLPGAFFFGLLYREHRQRLATIRPYMGVLLGCMMFIPVIIWNAENSWNSVRHVAYIGGANEGFAIHFDYLGDFLASQAALLSPLIFILILAAWVCVAQKKYAKNKENWIYPYLFYTSFPMFAMFLVLSLHTRIYGNWPGAGYLTASILAAVYFSGQPQTRSEPAKSSLLCKLWPWSLMLSFMISSVVLLQNIYPFLPIPVELDRTATEVTGWQAMGEKAGEMREAMPHPAKTFLFGLRYQYASELAFYTPGKPRTVSINRWMRPNVYDYWVKDDDIMGWDAVGVIRDPAHFVLLQQVFDRVEPPVELKIFRKPGLFALNARRQFIKSYFFCRAYGFKGGLRWLPADKTDVRVE
jgi:hypothetical protein